MDRSTRSAADDINNAGLAQDADDIIKGSGIIPISGIISGNIASQCNVEEDYDLIMNHESGAGSSAQAEDIRGSAIARHRISGANHRRIKHQHELTRRLLKRASRWIGHQSMRQLHPTPSTILPSDDRIIIDRHRRLTAVNTDMRRWDHVDEYRRQHFHHGIDKAVDRSALLRELWSLHCLIPRYHTFGDLDSQVIT